MSSRWFQYFIPMHACLLVSALYPHQHPQPAHNHHHHGNTEMYSTGMTHQSVEYWIVLEYLVHTKMAIKFKRPLCIRIVKIKKRKRPFFVIACAACCLCHSWYMVQPQTWPRDPLHWALMIGGNSHCLYWCCRCSSLSHITCVSLFLLFNLTLLSKGLCYCGSLALGLGPRSTVFCLLWALAQLIIQRMY